jgi:anti-anti-sigma factor
MTPLTFQMNRHEQQAVVHVAGDLDMDGVLRLEPALNEAFARGDVAQVTLDLTDLSLIDSMAMALIIEAYNGARRHNIELRLRRGRGRARPIVRIAAIEQMLAFEHPR